MLELGRGAGAHGDSLGSRTVFLPFLTVVIDCDTCPFTAQLTVFSGIL